MSEQNHIDIVVAGFNSDKSDDTILQELFESGVPFTDLRSIFNTIVSENELRLSAKERKIKTNEFLDGWVPTDSEEMLGKVSALQDILKVTTTKAMGSMRTWAKANEVTLPKAPRKEKTRKVGFGGHYRKILDYVMSNREASREDVAAFCKGNEIPEGYVTTALNIVEFAKEWNGELIAVAEAA